MTVIVASIAFGRQVLHWWHELSPPARKLARPVHMADPFSGASLQSIAFGDQSWKMRRQEVRGDIAQAPQRLLAN